MARIRTIKPEFWTDAKIGEVSVSARLLFIASWNFADDYGGIDRSSKQLKAQAFPYDVIDCEPLVQELLKVGLLVEYRVGDRDYLHIKGFLTHQKIENPSKARIPPYKEATNNLRGIPEASPSPQTGREGKGRESKGKEVKSARASAARLTDDFQLTSERRKTAEAERLDPDRTFAKFCDYWRAASGAKARKHDWDATWRNWCRTEVDHGRGGSIETMDARKRRGEEAAWSRVKTHATQVGCPLQPREHDTPDSFETLVKNWENQNGRRSGSGPATVGSVLAKVGRS